jgi:hypothetical protein
MRRRKLFTLAAGVSAVLCAGVISEMSDVPFVGANGSASPHAF